MSAPGHGGALPHPAEVVERALQAASGPSIVLVHDIHEAEVRVANNTATTNGVRFDRRVTAVRVVDTVDGPAAGVASGGGDVDVVALLAAAERDASPADDASPLVEGDAAAGWADDAATTDLGALDAVLDGLAGALERAAAGDTVLSGYAEHRVATTYLGSTTGLRRRHAQPTGALQLVGRRHGHSTWAGTGTADWDDADVGALEARVAQGLDWGRRQVELPAGRYEVVLPPDSVADLMTYLVESASGRGAEEGRTVFSRPGGGTRIGDTVSPLAFDLWSDPSIRGLERAPFVATGASGADVSVFDNGLDLGRTDWLRAGRIERLVYHRAGAARAGVPATPPIDNLALALPGADESPEDLVRGTERGLLLTCLWYIRQVDPKTLLLTGLTRDGVYLIENGAVVGAVNNFRFNESPVDLLARATQASRSVRALGREFGEWMNRTRMPALRIPDFNMSSVSRGV